MASHSEVAIFSVSIHRLDGPCGPDTLHRQALLAQLAEQLTLNQRVIGSSPIQGIPESALTIPSGPISFLTALEPVSNWTGCAKSAPKTVGAPWGAGGSSVVNERTKSRHSGYT